jgi:D-alanyl-D-alanine carboxypeptidase
MTPPLINPKEMALTTFVRKSIPALFCITFFCVSAHAAKYTAIVTDLKSGQVLAQKDAAIPTYPASLTKLMTLYLALEAVTQNRISLSSRIIMSRNAASQPPSKWGVAPKQGLSLRQCLSCLMTRSSNDIAVGIAENLASSQSTFVHRMNIKAIALGMHHTQFYNPSGLHHPRHKSTARDMAILLRALCRDFPKYMHFLAIPFVQKGKIRMPNTNKLLGRVTGVRLGKTGFTRPAGWNLITLTQRANRGIITVVMGMPTGTSRNQHVTHLIETFYRNPQNLKMAISQPASHRPISMTAKPSKTFLKQSPGVRNNTRKNHTALLSISGKGSPAKPILGKTKSLTLSKRKKPQKIPANQLALSNNPPLPLNLVLQKNINQVEGIRIGKAECQPIRTQKMPVKKKSNKTAMKARKPIRSKFFKTRIKPTKPRTTMA